MLIISDLHLGKENDSYLVDGIPVQRLDVWNALCYIGDLARKTKQSISFAGDIFNKLNPITLILALWFKFLTRYSDITIYVIPGNHDSGTDWVNTRMLSEIDIAHVVCVTDPALLTIKDATGEANVLFYPHIPLAQRETVISLEVMLDKFKPDFCITHGQVIDSEYSNDIFFEAGDAMELDLSKLSGLIFSGHIHTQGSFKTDNVKVVYPGSVTINNFGEVNEVKGYLEVPLRDPDKYTERVFPEDMGARWQHIELDLTDKDETSLDEEAIDEIASGAIIKITVLAKQYGVVDESYVRALFNKYGHVTRYETKVVGDRTEVKSQKKTVSHTKLLTDWLGDSPDVPVKDRMNAKKMGEQIITEVLA